MTYTPPKRPQPYGPILTVTPPEPPAMTVEQAILNCSYPVPQDIIMGAINRFYDEVCLPKDKAGDSLSRGVFMFFVNYYTPEMTKRQAAGIPGDGETWARWSGEAYDVLVKHYKQANPADFQ